VLTVRVIEHPLVAVRLSELRDADTGPARFRALLEDIATLLAFEATSALATRPVAVTTPVAEAVGAALVSAPVLVPVLRAGLGLLPPFVRLLPGSTVAMAGLRRDEATLQPEWYLDGIPTVLDGRPVLVLDPMLATGGTLIEVLGVLASRGVGPIVVVTVLAAPEGLAALERAVGDASAVSLVTAAVDAHLSPAGWIVPGLGDAGDRQNNG
jgi:uracil phosphoribosyltransferase